MTFQLLLGLARSMRGRHTAAILRMMSVTDTIAEFIDDYVALAVRLAARCKLAHGAQRPDQRRKTKFIATALAFQRSRDFWMPSAARRRHIDALCTIHCFKQCLI